MLSLTARGLERHAMPSYADVDAREISSTGVPAFCNGVDPSC
jgi:hypothetical protein